MKFKVGDKVRVISKEKAIYIGNLIGKDIRATDYGRLTFFEYMQSFCGEEFTIKRITSEGNYEVHEQDSYWAEWMLESTSTSFSLFEHDSIQFSNLTYRVLYSKKGKNFLAIYGRNDEFNDGVFQMLDLDKKSFTTSILGYCGDGDFPYCKSLEDLTTLTLALAEEAQKQGIEVKLI
jgi:hypothetical protein